MSNATLIDQYRAVKHLPATDKARRDLESQMMFEFSQAIQKRKKFLQSNRTNEHKGKRQ